MWKLTDKFDPDSLGDEERARVDRRITLAVVLCVMLGIGAAVSALWVKPSFRDTLSAPVQSATGRITRVSYTRGESELSANPFYVSVLEIDGKSLEVGTLEQELKKGQRVRFTYRPGKSGRWYLQSIQPQ